MISRLSNSSSNKPKRRERESSSARRRGKMTFVRVIGMHTPPSRDPFIQKSLMGNHGYGKSNRNTRGYSLIFKKK